MKGFPLIPVAALPAALFFEGVSAAPVPLMATWAAGKVSKPAWGFIRTSIFRRRPKPVLLARPVKKQSFGRKTLKYGTVFTGGALVGGSIIHSHDRTSEDRMLRGYSDYSSSAEISADGSKKAEAQPPPSVGKQDETDDAEKSKKHEALSKDVKVDEDISAAPA